MQKGFISPEEANLAAKRELNERFIAQQAAFREQQAKEAKKVNSVYS